MAKLTAAQTSKAKVEEVIVKAQNSTKAMRGDIQLAAVMVLQHAHKFGDYTLANELVWAVAEGTNIKSLVNWFEIYGGLIVDSADSSLGFTSWKKAEHIKENFEKAKSTNWWTCKPATPFKGYDLMEELEKLVKLAQKKAQEQRKYESEGDSEKVDAIAVDNGLLHKLSELTKTHGGKVEPAPQAATVNVKDVASTPAKKTTQEPKAA